MVLQELRGKLTITLTVACAGIHRAVARSLDQICKGLGVGVVREDPVCGQRNFVGVSVVVRNFTIDLCYEVRIEGQRIASVGVGPFRLSVHGVYLSLWAR